jgi:hypothetical protein
MAAPGVGGIASIVWALMLFGPRVALATPAESPAIQLRLGASGGLDQASLRLTERTVAELLLSAGIGADWRDCRPQEQCESDHLVVLVQLLSVPKMTDGEACGEFVRDQRSGTPTVIVYLPRVVEMLLSIRAGSSARSNPALASVEIGHLLGLTIAHEVGHALGLTHGTSGVMKARPSLNEVVALRRSKLMFGHREQTIMRIALVARSDELMARAR